MNGEGYLKLKCRENNDDSVRIQKYSDGDLCISVYCYHYLSEEIVLNRSDISKLKKYLNDNFED